MSETPTPGPGGQPQPQVRMLAHFVRDLSFENVGVIEGNPAEGQPEIEVTVNLEGNGIGENRFQTAMKISATAKTAGKNTYLAELDYVGIFQLENVPQEHVHPIVFIECPRLLLPFARRVVADVTRDGGYRPFMIDNIDFAALYRQRLDQLRAQQAAQEPEGEAGPRPVENGGGQA